MLILFVTISMSIALVFMFRIEWLYGRKTIIPLLSYTILLVVISIVLKIFAKEKPQNLELVTIPLFSLLFFYLISFIFKKIYKRNPENTFWEFTRKPVEDVIFTIVFWIFGVGSPYLFVENIAHLYS